MRCAMFAVCSRALLGTQPDHRQSPPRRFFSMSATLAPSAAPPAATTSPPEPPPMTQRSKSVPRMFVLISRRLSVAADLRSSALCLGHVPTGVFVGRGAQLLFFSLVLFFFFCLLC